jgi:hypothetical protein
MVPSSTVVSAHSVDGDKHTGAPEICAMLLNANACSCVVDAGQEVDVHRI